jgi:hypothetical protein
MPARPVLVEFNCVDALMFKFCLNLDLPLSLVKAAVFEGLGV